MAENKPSFILYADLIHVVRKLPKLKRGDFFLHILEYVNDENPQTDDLLIQIAFEPVKQQLKRHLKKWDATKVSHSDSGRLGNLKRWHGDLYEQVSKNEITIEQAEEIAKHRKTSQGDKQGRKVLVSDENIANVAVNVNVPVSVNENVNIKEQEQENLQNEVLPLAPKKENNVLPINTYRKINHLVLLNEDYEKLAANYTKTQIDDILDAIENFKGNKKYTSLYYTAKQWLKKEHPGISKTYHQPENKTYF